MRGIEYLTPETQKMANQLVQVCMAAGYNIKVTDTLRTKEEQDELYQQGRTKPGNIVTNVSYPNSMHNWGVAFDICRNEPGKAFDNSDGFFDMVGAVGRQLGLEWGGDWKSIVDKPHFQLSRWGSTPKKLIAQYGNPSKFLATSNTEREPLNIKCRTCKQGSRGLCVKVIQAVVGSKVDGIFGEDTKQKVKQFQLAHSISSDGIVGRNTWDKIFTMMATDY